MPLYTYAVSTQDPVIEGNNERTEQRIALTPSAASLRWSLRDAERPAHLLTRQAEPDVRLGFDGATYFDVENSPQQYGPGRPTAVNPTALPYVEYDWLGVLEPRFYRTDGAYASLGTGSAAYYRPETIGAGWAHTPSAEALAELDKWWYPTPDGMIGSLAVSKTAPSHPSPSSWYLQPHMGHPWTSSHQLSGGTRVDAYGMNRRFPLTARLANNPRYQFDPSTRTLYAPPPPGELAQDGGSTITFPYVKETSLDWRGGIMPTYYGLPSGEIVVASRYSAGPETRYWRVLLRQYDGDESIIDESDSGWTAMGEADGVASVFTSIPVFGSLRSDAVWYQYFSQSRYGSEGLPAGALGGGIWHKIPCYIGPWANGPGSMSSEGAGYRPGWLRAVGSI